MPDTPPPEGRTAPLQLLLATASVALILIVSAALIGLGFTRARDAALRDATANMQVFSARLLERLNALSEPVTSSLGLLTAVPNAFLTSPPERWEDKARLLAEVMRRAPHLDGVFAGYPDGSFFHRVNLSPPGWRETLGAPEAAQAAIRMIRGDEPAPVARVIFLDAAGRMLGEATPTDTDFDPRLRPWYIAALGQARAVATQPYRMVATGRIGVTVAQAHGINPEIVLGADIVLGSIGTFLAAERLTPGTVTFVVDATGRPVIHSDPAVMARLLSRNADEAGPTGDAVLDALAAVDAGTGEAMRTLTVGEQRYVTLAVPLGTHALLAGHRVVVAAPLRELTEEARQSTLHALAVAAVVVVGAVLIALMVARLITRSLYRLTDGAERLQNLDFVTPIDVRSRIREISTLERSMNRARDAINTFALYVPKEFVRTGLREGHFDGRGAHRQEVTALFTDIYDFTTISEAHAPEEVVAMLSDYFDILDEVVRAHDGSIIQFLGDSIFAMWNAPVPDPDHAEHACRAALAAVDRLAQFNAGQRARGLPELRTRFGINAGLAVVGSVGARERLQYTAMGDVINVASRLEGMNKEHGTAILASAAVAERCGDTIAFRALGTAQAKGRAEALAIYEVLGPTGAP
ncbi:MAG: adenylate/guanylate cyclase domain-containing protein [Gemmobacter sp.]